MGGNHAKKTIGHRMNVEIDETPQSQYKRISAILEGRLIKDICPKCGKTTFIGVQLTSGQKCKKIRLNIDNSPHSCKGLSW